MQIVTKENELDTLHAGLKKMEDSLDQSHAEKDRERQQYHAKVRAVLQQKAALQRQLQSKQLAQDTVYAAGVASKLAAMTEKAAALQEAKRRLEQQVIDRQVCLHFLSGGVPLQARRSLCGMWYVHMSAACRLSTTRQSSAAARTSWHCHGNCGTLRNVQWLCCKTPPGKRTSCGISTNS